MEQRPGEAACPEARPGGIVTVDPYLEKSIRLGREQCADMALWLAVEVLATAPEAQEDDELQGRLSVLQEKLEARMRAAVTLA